MRGMEDIAVALGLSSKAEHANAAKSWMETRTNGSWLLILDAAGSEAVSEFRELSAGAMENNFVQRLPQRSTSPRRTILVTTCQHNVALKWCRRPDLAFEVPFLKPKDATDLLRSTSGDRQSVEQDVIDLAEELDGNPSALLAAAALIRAHSGAGETVSNFLARCRRDKDKFIAFFDGTHPSTHELYETSYTVTLVKTIEAVQRSSEDACNLLFLIACLDGTSISSKLFCHAFEWEDNTLELRAPISTLLNYRIISGDQTTGYYRMPKFVRLTTRQWIRHHVSTLEDAKPLPTWHLKALESLLKAYDSIQLETRYTSVEAQLQRRALLPHAAAFQQFCRYEGRCTVMLQEDHYRAIVVFAKLFSDEGQYKSAEDMLGFARESPVDSSEDLRWRKIAMLRLAESLRNQTLVDGKSKRLKKALRIVREVEQSPGGVESDLWSTSALLLADRGRFDEAAVYQIMAVKFLSQEYGKDNPQTLEARLELSKIRWREGHPEEALEEQEEIERIFQTGPPSPNPEDTSRLLQVRAALVRTHYSLDDLHTAIGLAEKVVEGMAQVFGDLDMKTVGSEKDLAQCLIDSNRPSEARLVIERIGKKLQQKFDFDHQEVQDCIKRLDGIDKEVLRDGIRSICCGL